jgi:hypothetical protein
MDNSAYVGLQLAKLAVLFRAELGEEQLKIYLEELGSLTTEQIDSAVKHIRQTWKPSGPNPFPAICDILSACGESPNDVLAAAIATVKKAVRDFGQYDSVSFCDPALHRAIRDFVGGWVALCGWEDRDWDVRAGRLIEAYRVAKMKGLDGGNHLAGIHERNNGWVSVRYVDVRDNSITGKISFKGELTEQDLAVLNNLCYSSGRGQTAVQSSGGAAVALTGGY